MSFVSRVNRTEHYHFGINYMNKSTSYTTLKVISLTFWPNSTGKKKVSSNVIRKILLLHKGIKVLAVPELLS